MPVPPIPPGAPPPLTNFTATVDPTIANDNTQGYTVGSAWLNTLTGISFIATSTSTGQAMWVKSSESTWQNIDPRFFPNFRLAIANTRAGVRNTKILCPGDSISRGVGSTNDQNINTNIYSYPSQLGYQLTTALGMTATARNNFQGDGYLTFAATTDPRLTVGSGWVSFTNTGNQTLAGDLLTNSTTTNALSFQPVAAYDTVLLYIVDGASATATLSSGSATTNFTTTGSPLALRTITLNVGSVTSNPVNIVRNTGSNIYVIGCDTYLSTTKQISIYNCGASGITASNLTVNTYVWSPTNMLGSSGYVPDLTILSIGSNDVVSGTSTTSFSSQVQTAITAAKTSGDVLLVSWPPSSAANESNGVADGLITVLRQLAYVNNCGFINIKRKLVSYSASSALYWVNGNNQHPNQLGTSDFAASIVNALRNLIA